jgi:cation diffusion facilitator CzcD-associated flavoprotein CzcO
MTANTATDLLIIGAGPFGLAIAAEVERRGIAAIAVGEPMAFWKRHMPRGMFLRSGVDWHLDAAEGWTISRFLEASGLTATDVRPFPLDVYLDYVEWFAAQASIRAVRGEIVSLDRLGDRGDGFRASLATGDTVTARNVVVAIGFANFARVPPEMAERLPAQRVEHTCTAVDLEALAGDRCLIVGGRQSAFEWAALLAEAGASVDVAYRHDTPRFTESDWTWAGKMVERFVQEPGWFRRLTAAEREAVARRFWEEGRLKLEPWLEPRIRAGGVRLWPRREVVATQLTAADAIAVRFQSGESIEVDQVILATGYRPEIQRVPFLAAGNLLSMVKSSNDCPALDDHMQSSVPGLYFTSLLATNDFGPFFAFTVSARAAATLIGRDLSNRR